MTVFALVVSAVAVTAAFYASADAVRSRAAVARFRRSIDTAPEVCGWCYLTEDHPAHVEPDFEVDDLEAQLGVRGIGAVSFHRYIPAVVIIRRPPLVTPAQRPTTFAR